MRHITNRTPVLTIYPEINAEDALTSMIRNGAREILAAALEAEIDDHINHFRGVIDSAGKRRVVRNGYLPERHIQTGAGKLPIKQPRARVRGQVAASCRQTLRRGEGTLFLGDQGFEWRVLGLTSTSGWL